MSKRFDSHRKILEKFAVGSLPLNRAIRAGLDRIEELEATLQMAVDDLTDSAEVETSTVRIARKLLQGETQRPCKTP